MTHAASRIILPSHKELLVGSETPGTKKNFVWTFGTTVVVVAVE